MIAKKKKFKEEDKGEKSKIKPKKINKDIKSKVKVNKSKK